MNQINDGQSIQTRDFAQALVGQSGTFLVSRPGTTLIVVCQEGHSIRSVRAAGSQYPSIALVGVPQDLWEVEKLNNSTDGARR